MIPNYDDVINQALHLKKKYSTGTKTCIFGAIMSGVFTIISIWSAVDSSKKAGTVDGYLQMLELLKDSHKNALL